jgi:Domain of unknown function (DUF4314)
VDRALLRPLKERTLPSIGSQIEFTGSSHEQLRAGDRGVVKDIDETGDIIVSWERGFALQIDPDTTSFQPLPA